MKPVTHLIMLTWLCLTPPLFAREYHVAKTGSDADNGTSTLPLLTIQAAAELAEPGDVILIHKGVYRERVNPPRGGTSNDMRITYRSSPGDEVVITGSEVVGNWTKVNNDTWKADVDNAIFGEFNPYLDTIHGDWFGKNGQNHLTGAVYLNGEWLLPAFNREDVLNPAGQKPLWFSEVNNTHTIIWAQFKGVDPNQHLVEINVRQTVFYPENTGRNFISVRNLIMRHAATPWSPPTAEQIGLIGTNWSKGWIIENNHISYSRCVGVTLGKYGDEYDNTSANSANGYVNTINRAVANGWTKEIVGSHMVRNNYIHHCEQSGLVGSLGAIFSTISGNTIHDIHVHRQFKGAEQAAIKIHAPIDMLISNNNIRNSRFGIWLDWMSQGTRVTGNLVHDAEVGLFIEVNHGPYLIDNNIVFAEIAFRNASSRGGAYVHNMFAGKILCYGSKRETPFHEAHSTEIAGLRSNIDVGDDRLYNNIFIERFAHTKDWDDAVLPVSMDGNVYLHTAEPGVHDKNAIVNPAYNPNWNLSQETDGTHFEVTLDNDWRVQKTRSLVTTEMLGNTTVTNGTFESPDGSPISIDTDFFGKPRNTDNPFPGPFAEAPDGELLLFTVPDSTTPIYQPKWTGKRNSSFRVYSFSRSNQTTLKLSNVILDGAVTISIKDLQGNTVLQTTTSLHNGTASISFESKNKGIHLAVIKGTGKTLSQKIIVR